MPAPNSEVQPADKKLVSKDTRAGCLKHKKREPFGSLVTHLLAIRQYLHTIGRKNPTYPPNVLAVKLWMNAVTTTVHRVNTITHR